MSSPTQESKRQRTFDISMWEGEDQIVSNLGVGDLTFEIKDETQTPMPTLTSKTKALIERLELTIGQWQTNPTQEQVGGLSIIGLYLEMATLWDSKSDTLLARIIGLLAGKTLRAHPDACYQYESGGWEATKALPQHVVLYVESSIALAKYIFKELQDKKTLRKWNDVFAHLQNYQGWANFEPVEFYDLKDKHWASVAGLSLDNIPYRLVSAGRGASALDCFTEFFQEPRPRSKPMLNAINVCLEIDCSRPKDKYLQQKAKKPENNCYLVMRCSIHNSVSFKANDSDKKRFRTGLITAFAGNPEGRRMVFANDLLGVLELQNVQVCLFHRGDGGNSKTAMSILRNSLYFGTHKFISATVFENEDEHRKQGINFAYCRAGTIQESATGVFIRPDLYKNTVGGGQFPVRPNYGKETLMVSLLQTAFNWECNNAPRLRLPGAADPKVALANFDVKKVRSMIRRVRVVDYYAIFVGDPTKVDIANKVFLDDSELIELFSSGLGAYLHLHEYLLPFLAKYTLKEVRSILANPSGAQLKLVEEFVKEMFGVTEGNENDCFDKTGDDAAHQAATVLAKVHEATVAKEGFVKRYFFQTLHAIPGSQKVEGTLEKPSKLDNFRKMVDMHKYLFKFDFTKDGYRRLRIDLARFNATASRCSVPDYTCYPIVFDMMEELKDAADYDPEFISDEVSTRGDSLTPRVGTQMDGEHVDAKAVEVVVNMQALRQFEKDASLKRDEKKLLKAYLVRLRTHGRKLDAFPDGMVLDVDYVARSGRLYAVGVTQQCLGHVTRMVCAQGSAAELAGEARSLDVDFVLCVITVLNILASNHGVAHLIPQLEKVKDSPSDYKHFLTEYYGTDTKDVKGLIYKGVFGARPHDGNLLLWSITLEARQLCQALLELPEYQDFKNRFATRKNPMASCLAAICFTTENAYLCTLIRTLNDKLKDKVNVSVRIFDGVVINLLQGCSEADVQAALDDYNAENTLKAIIKPWDRE
jgi:hypothetical protein